MSFTDELQNITMSSRSSSSSENELDYQIETFVQTKLNEIKERCKTKATQELYVYDLSEKKKTIYGLVDFLRVANSDDLYSFMYEKRKYNYTLKSAGLKAYETLSSFCKNENISIKIGINPPSNNKPDVLKNWYTDSLISSPANHAFDNPYQLYLGYKIELEMTTSEVNDLTPTSSDGCYIATAVYGSYDCPEVWTLRRFRDYSLAESCPGRLFIKIYYKTSPTLVRLFGKTRIFQCSFKYLLDRFVGILHKKGYEDLPYQDRHWN